MAKHRDPNQQTLADHYLRLLSRTQSVNLARVSQAITIKEIDINQEIARAQKIKNDDAEQDIKLKRSTLRGLFRLLVVETIAIFALTAFQAMHWPLNFRLEEWSFRVLVGATLLQIATMLGVAVKYLFPRRMAGRR
jgi:hypothetical protein